MVARNNATSQNEAPLSCKSIHLNQVRTQRLWCHQRLVRSSPAHKQGLDGKTNDSPHVISVYFRRCYCFIGELPRFHYRPCITILSCSDNMHKSLLCGAITLQNSGNCHISLNQALISYAPLNANSLSDKVSLFVC